MQKYVELAFLDAWILDSQIIGHLAEAQARAIGANTCDIFLHIGADDALQGHMPVIHNDVDGTNRLQPVSG